MPQKRTKDRPDAPSAGSGNQDVLAGLRQPLESGYNPHTAGHGPAAKLWELLRRNPDFRITAHDLEQTNPQDRRDYDSVRGRFRGMDEQSPFAGFALRWLFRPQWLQFHFPRQSHDFFKPWTVKDWAESGFPWLSEEKLFDLEEILKWENEGEAYLGPLKVSAGPFTLETPWPETPDLFRFLFSWLWEEYEFDRLSGCEAAHHVMIGKVDEQGFQIDWSFLDTEHPQLDWNTLYGLRRLKLLLEHHDLFAVPHLMMTRKQEKRLKDHFADQILANRGFIDVRKYPVFLGGKNDWLVFDSCRPGISYESDPAKPDQPPQRLGSGKSLSELIDTRRLKGRWRGDWSTHAKSITK